MLPMMLVPPAPHNEELAFLPGPGLMEEIRASPRLRRSEVPESTAIPVRAGFLESRIRLLCIRQKREDKISFEVLAVLALPESFRIANEWSYRCYHVPLDKSDREKSRDSFVLFDINLGWQGIDRPLLHRARVSTLAGKEIARSRKFLFRHWSFLLTEDQAVYLHELTGTNPADVYSPQ